MPKVTYADSALLNQNIKNYVWGQHTLPIEQHTKAHNTFYEPLTAIVAHQVMEHNVNACSAEKTKSARYADIKWKQERRLIPRLLRQLVYRIVGSSM